MLDFSHLVSNDKNTSVFYSIGTGDTFQTWTKPKGCSFINIFCLGSGGGGGAGASGVNGTVRCGGAGGGTGGHTKIMIPSFFLPDTLYIKVGKGGDGGLPTSSDGTSGITGELSYVSIRPDSISTNVIVSSGTLPANGGGRGIFGVGSNATAGAASTIFSQTNGILSYLGLTSFMSGSAGGNGGNQNQSGGGLIIGSGGTFSLPSMVIGGAGGAGCQSAGGAGGSKNGAQITGNGFMPTINSGQFTSQTIADNGYTTFNYNSTTNRNGLFFTGGAGGFAHITLNGGPGGNGNLGCGGGGGGGGISGGKGGNGGDGLVIITWF